MATPPATPCGACQSASWLLSFEGDVRRGTAGRYRRASVWRCETCGVEFLPPAVGDLTEFYATDAYRSAIGESSRPEDFFARHDVEQFDKVQFLRDLSPRGQVIMDVGCAAGAFLDMVAGLARQTIGVDPATSYHESLRSRGHLVFADVRDVASTMSDGVGIATMFSVIEHLPDPLDAVREIHRRLRPGGHLVLSTPNRRDFLLEAGVPEYRSFFYRDAHTYYFDDQSLARLGRAAGFREVSLRFHQRFGFGNAVGWMVDRVPTGSSRETVLGHGFDRRWATELELAGVADYLYAIMTK